MYSFSVSKIFGNFLIFFLSCQSILSQVGNEFSIEVGPDSCYATSFALDETKYIVVMRKELKWC